MNANSIPDNCSEISETLTQLLDRLNLSDTTKETQDEKKLQSLSQVQKPYLTYKRKSYFIDWRTIPIPKDRKKPCPILDQLSIYNQNPPYPPCKPKVHPFSRNPSTPDRYLSSLYGEFPGSDQDKTMLLFNSPMKSFKE